MRILGLVAFAMLFENYDLGLIGAALPQIAAEFDLSNPEKGTLLGSVDSGSALFAFLIVALADRFGRRRMLLAGVVGMALGALLSALAPDPTAFAVAQIVTRSFAMAATAISFVVVAEELPAAHRGWGIGWLGAAGTLGFGLGNAVYSQVNVLPYGWRTVYGIGFLAIFLLPFFRRNLKETRRFEDARARLDTREPILLALFRPVVDLARRYPRRALVIGLLGALSTAGHRPAFRFVSDFVQGVHGWTPADYALVTIVFGIIGVVGGPLAGWLADRIGRRAVGALMLAPFPVFATLFYTQSGWVITLPWIAMLFFAMGASAVVRSLSAELFPTAMRSAAGGWVLMLETLGGGLGAFLFAAIERQIQAWGTSLSIVSVLAGVSALTLFFLPETRSRELETISEG